MDNLKRNQAVAGLKKPLSRLVLLVREKLEKPEKWVKIGLLNMFISSFGGKLSVVT
jgi:hypothetical protein